MTEKNLSSDWSFGRLFQLKKDVHDLQNAFENIVNFGYSTEEITDMLSSDDVPQELKELADHPLVRVGGEIKSKLPSLAGFIKLTNPTLPKYAQDSIDKELVKSSDRSNLLEFNKITRKPTIKEDGSQIDLPELPKLTDEHILLTIFTDKSAVSDPTLNVTESNEKLAIIGKAVFQELLVTEIYKSFDHLNSFAFSKLQALACKPKQFMEWSKLYDLQQYTIQKLNLKKGEVSLIHGEVILAYIGGLFVDSGYTHIKLTSWIHTLLQKFFDTIDIADLSKDLEKSGESTETSTSNDPVVESYDPQQAMLDVPFSSGSQQYVNGTPIEANILPQTSVYPQSYQHNNQPFPLPPHLAQSTPFAHALKFSKETLYRKVCLAFIPEYTVEATKGPKPGFRCSCAINGEVIGVGVHSSSKLAGNHAAFNALNHNMAAVERYSNLAKAVKIKVVPFPPKYEVSLDLQVQRFPPDGCGPPQ